MNLSWKQIRDQFGKTVLGACVVLCVSYRVLRRECQRHGLLRWPYPQVKALIRQIRVHSDAIPYAKTVLIKRKLEDAIVSLRASLQWIYMCPYRRPPAPVSRQFSKREMMKIVGSLSRNDQPSPMIPIMPAPDPKHPTCPTVPISPPRPIIRHAGVYDTRTGCVKLQNTSPDLSPMRFHNINFGQKCALERQFPNLFNETRTPPSSVFRYRGYFVDPLMLE